MHVRHKINSIIMLKLITSTIYNFSVGVNRLVSCTQQNDHFAVVNFFFFSVKPQRQGTHVRMLFKVVHPRADGSQRISFFLLTFFCSSCSYIFLYSLFFNVYEYIHLITAN